MIQVSDHALVRFMERTAGLDAAALKRSIAQSLERASMAADAIDICNYAVVIGTTSFVVRDGVVITVLERGAKIHLAQRRRRA